MRPGRIIAVANHKGGVGKTTTAFTVAGQLAANGHRVLLCDLDPQASLTKLLGFQPRGLLATVADLLLGTDLPSGLIQGTSIPGVHLIGANNSLADAEKQLISRMNRERALARALRPLAEHFDYVLLDCPPALDLLNTNGLAAADEVLVPLESSHIALEALGDFMRTVEEVRREVNPGLELRGILVTKHQAHTSHSQGVLEELRQRYPGKVLNAAIPYSVRAKDSVAVGRPLTDLDPRSPASQAYRDATNELTNHA